MKTVVERIRKLTEGAEPGVKMVEVLPVRRASHISDSGSKHDSGSSSKCAKSDASPAAKELRPN